MKENKKWTYYVVVVLIVILGVIYFMNYRKDSTKEAAALFFDNEAAVDDSILEEQPVENKNNDETQRDALMEKETKDELMYVHVCGAVKQSGVYILAAGSRVIDAVSLAGGFSEDAAVNAINQAQKLTDGLRLYIPTLDDLENTSITQEEYPVITSTPVNNPSNDMVGSENKININTADKKTLMTLPGIGESKAQSIITYREKNGKFSSIEDIQKISGIKEAVYKKIKDIITVSE